MKRVCVCVYVSCMELVNVCLLTTVCVKLLGLYLPVYTFCCMRASVSGLMALYDLHDCPVDFPLNISIHSLSQFAAARAVHTTHHVG